MRITVIGCGRWGSLIAWYLDRTGHAVTLYGRPGSRHMQRFLATRRNDLLELPESIRLSTDLSCVRQAEIVVISIGSQGLQGLMDQLRPLALRDKIFVLCMKGLEQGTGRRLSQIAQENLDPSNAVAVWLGPGHVQEFYRGIPNCMVIDSSREDVKRLLVQSFSSDLIRFYYGEDLIGNEVGAAAKNVIILLADGLSVGHRTAARILSKGVKNGMYQAPLAMDNMPHMALLGTSSVDTIAADSANTASAYMTGHKSSVNALGVYADRTKASQDDPRQETIAELLRRKTGKAIGVVSDAEIEDATPASVVAHTRRRSDKADIVGMFYEVRPEVILGGGSAYFLPQGTPGSKRKDSTNYLELFQKDGYKFVSDRTELLAAVDGKAPQKLLGLFHTGNMDGWIDRHQWKGNTVKKFPNQPDLTDAFDAAVKVLGQNKEGFFLMLEAGLVDKFSHPLDWTRSVGDTIAFDKVVERAQKYVDEHPDTLLIVTGDHTHSISVAGTVDDNKPGKDMREKVGVYADAGYPNYVDADKDGFPDDFAPSKRLAVFFGAHPDYYETYRAYPDKTLNPAVKNEKGEYVADETYKSVEGGHFVEGNLPRNESQGVHTVDDLVVTARGPKSEEIKGFMNSTEIFRVMAEALALGH